MGCERHVSAQEPGEPTQAVLLYSVLHYYCRLFVHEHGNLLVHYATARFGEQRQRRHWR